MPTLTLFTHVLDFSKLNTSSMKIPLGSQTTTNKRKQQQPTLTPTFRSISQHQSIIPIKEPQPSSSSSPIPSLTPTSSFRKNPFSLLRPTQHSSVITSPGHHSFISTTDDQAHKTQESTPWDFIKKQPYDHRPLQQPKRLLRKCSSLFTSTRLKREESTDICDTKEQPVCCFRSLPSPDVERKKKKKMVYDPIQWPCVLVQDAVEQDRLVAQHYLLRTAFGGNDYTAPVHFLLSQQQQQQPLDESLLGPVVLDIGCGLGQWSMEMATAYPKSTFIGVDLLDNFPQDIKPKNCRFMSLDVRQLPLPFDDQSIDYIYQRDLNWGLLQDEWNPLIKEYMRILKPGGWIELVEADMETKSSLGKECAMNDKLLEGFGLRHQDPYAARRLPSMLATCGFRRVESQFQSLPLGWSNQNQAITSQYIFYLRSLGPWLRLVMGLNQEKYMDYVDQLPLEWNQAQTYVNWHCATAQKPYKS